MSQNVYDRIGVYFRDVSKVLRGEADAATIFPNASDIGGVREEIYATFLRQHAPSKCNVFLGGFLFHEDGSESAQLDVIVTTDTTPRFDLHNTNGLGKSFSPIEGTLAVASIKSTVGKKELYDALSNIASIPPMKPIGKRIPPTFPTFNYEDWPFKIIFANRGIAANSIYRHVREYYDQYSTIPLERRPHIIHVAGECAIIRMIKGYSSFNVFTSNEKQIELGSFNLFTHDPDLSAITFVLNEIQQRALFSTHILFDHGYILNGVRHITT